MHPVAVSFRSARACVEVPSALHAHRKLLIRFALPSLLQKFDLYCRAPRYLRDAPSDKTFRKYLLTGFKQRRKHTPMRCKSVKGQPHSEALSQPARLAFAQPLSFTQGQARRSSKTTTASAPPKYHTTECSIATRSTLSFHFVPTCVSRQTTTRKPV